MSAIFPENLWKGKYQCTEHKKIGKERENCYRKMKKSAAERHKQTDGSLIEIF